MLVQGPLAFGIYAIGAWWGVVSPFLCSRLYSSARYVANCSNKVADLHLTQQGILNFFGDHLLHFIKEPLFILLLLSETEELQDLQISSGELVNTVVLQGSLFTFGSGYGSTYVCQSSFLAVH